jgi:hypothetical protein
VGRQLAILLTIGVLLSEYVKVDCTFDPKFVPPTSESADPSPTPMLEVHKENSDAPTDNKVQTLSPMKKIKSEKYEAATQFFSSFSIKDPKINCD